MADTFSHEDPFSVRSTSDKSQETGQVIKQGETFGILDRFGDILLRGISQQGLFHRGTRYLSRFVLTMAGERPVHLSSTLDEASALLTLDLMNPEILVDGEAALPAGTVHVLRSVFLWQGTCHQRLRLQHYGVLPVTVPLRLDFAGDFVDIFEVRGTHPTRRGRLQRCVAGPQQAEVRYDGADGVLRRTRMSFSLVPHALTESRAEFVFRLWPGDSKTLDVAVMMAEGPGEFGSVGFDVAFEEAARQGQQAAARTCGFLTDHAGLQRALDRSLADLHMMLTETEYGPYPFAGVPWFSCPFGRDGIITALESLWVYPEVARGTLQYLAATQATAVDAEHDAEPGKILHEARLGEMANLHEIPFGRYYGSVDATPLFVYLAGRYYHYSRDVVFLRQLWPAVEAALHWMEEYGDADHDGFIEYEKKTPNGLSNQGWKDSVDSVSHADGTLAVAPIALCEVQAYAYGAWTQAAGMLEALGQPAPAERYRQKAAELRTRFAQAFWLEDLGTYALALDHAKNPCRVRSSNAGHALTMGIASPEHARRLAVGLLSQDMFSGWGIRTLAVGEVRYNPMSYHNGSVWPHDNALIAMGLSDYGYKHEAARILAGLVDASNFFELHRLPELMSGFDRRSGQGPTRYPVACSPQAWAVAAPFMLLAACLGMSLEQGRQVTFRHPVGPEFLQTVHITQLRLPAGGSIDLAFHRHDGDVGITVLGKTGDVEVLVVK